MNRFEQIDHVWYWRTETNLINTEIELSHKLVKEPTFRAYLAEELEKLTRYKFKCFYVERFDVYLIMRFCNKFDTTALIRIHIPIGEKYFRFGVEGSGMMPFDRFKNEYPRYFKWYDKIIKLRKRVAELEAENVDLRDRAGYGQTAEHFVMAE